MAGAAGVRCTAVGAVKIVMRDLAGYRPLDVTTIGGIGLGSGSARGRGRGCGREEDVPA